MGFGGIGLTLGELVGAIYIIAPDNDHGKLEALLV